MEWIVSQFGTRGGRRDARLKFKWLPCVLEARTELYKTLVITNYDYFINIVSVPNIERAFE